MIQRVHPQEYFLESNNIPSWVPLLLAIALIGSFTVAIIAIWRGTSR